MPDWCFIMAADGERSLRKRHSSTFFTAFAKLKYLMQIKCKFKIMRSRPLWHSDKKDKLNIKKEQWDRREKLQYRSAKYREIWSNRETKANNMIYHQSWRIQYLFVIQFLCLMHDRVPLFHNESCFAWTGISVTSLTHVYVFISGLKSCLF